MKRSWTLGAHFDDVEAFLIRIDLESDGLACTRFVLSPLQVATDLLCHYARFPYTLSKQWRASVAEVLRPDGRLDLLAAVAGRSAHGYVPDFITPEPAAFDNEIDDQLHQVATANAERVGYEVSFTLSGHTWHRRGATRATSRVLLNTVARGERHVAEELAAQLRLFFDLVVAAQWPRLRKRLEDDIAVRAEAMAREGLGTVINRLSPMVRWHNGGLDIDRFGREEKGDRSHHGWTSASALILAPSVFQPRLALTADPYGAPSPRSPLLSYPAINSSPTSPRSMDEVFGATRSRVLTMLDVPRSTDELAKSLHLSPGTVSYHLQILFRAGMIHRTRSSRHVLYRKIPAK